MRIAAAQVPGIEVSDDCIYTTPNAVIMLDGASAFVPVQVPAALNAQHLGSSIQQRLASDLHADLTEVLGEAIANTADQLDLTPGHSRRARSQSHASPSKVWITSCSETHRSHFRARDADRAGQIPQPRKLAQRAWRTAASPGATMCKSSGR